MNRLKIFVVIGMITAFCSNFAWAASVEVVDVDVDRNALVNVSLCGDYIMEEEGFPKTQSDDGTFYILFSAMEQRVRDCVTIEESIPVPSCSEYNKIVPLLDSEITRVPDDGNIYEYLAVDSYDVELDVDIEGCCDEKVEKCMDKKAACLAVEEECMAACDRGGDLGEYLQCMSDCDCDEKYDCQPDSVCEVPEEEEVITVDCDPDTLNLKSNGNFVTCYLSSTHENGVEDIDQSSLWLHLADTTTSLPALFSAIEEDQLMVKFSRQALIAAIDETAVPLYLELMVSGDQDAGDSFEAMDTIKAIKPPKFKASLLGQTIILTAKDISPLAESATIFWGDRGSDTVPVAQLLSAGVNHTYSYRSKRGYRIRVQFVDSNGVVTNYTSTRDNNLEVVVQ